MKMGERKHKADVLIGQTLTERPAKANVSRCAREATLVISRKCISFAMYVEV